jgi:hypothetical protein
VTQNCSARHGEENNSDNTGTRTPTPRSFSPLAVPAPTAFNLLDFRSEQSRRVPFIQYGFVSSSQNVRSGLVVRVSAYRSRGPGFDSR